jgi:hypothetical protein
MTNRTSQLLFAAVLLLCSVFVRAQVTVAIAPNPHPKFTDNSGNVLSGGFLYTYQAGTTTLLNTYIDSTGTIQNPDPIPLDATGAPSNGSVQTGVWLGNQAYKFCAFNSALVLQWCTDNVTGYLGLLNLANTWTFQQTFLLPIDDTQTDNQLVLGSAGNLTTLDFPPPSANITLHMPNTADTIVGRNTTDTLLNKSLTTPTVNNVPITNNPGTYTALANASPTGTVTNALAILGGTGITNVTVATTSTTSGVLGICVSGCGTGGTGVIQQSGIASCIFDGPTTFNDAVIPSATVAGDCHDAGTTSVSNSIGYVLASNGTSGIYGILLSLTPAGGGTLCADGTTTSVNSSVTSQQVIKTCQIPAGRFNAIGKTFRLTTQQLGSMASGSLATNYWGFGTTAALGTYIAQSASTASVDTTGFLICTVITTGVTGTASCAQSGETDNAATGYLTPFQTTITANWTAPLYVGQACAFNAASTSNVCSSKLFVVEALN